ncbi:hypothetical protein D3C80_1178280 [compost metagenome]
MPIGRQPLEQPAVAEQTVEHTGQAAEDRRPAEHELRQVGHQAEQQGQRQQHQTALTPFDAPAQLPEPQAVHRQVQHAEVHQHRAERPPPLAGGQAVGQRQEVGVVALDAEIGEGQPADQLQVVAEPAGQRHGEGRQQHQRGDRQAKQSGQQRVSGRARGSCRQPLAAGDAGRVLGIQLAHALGELLVRYPEHLLAGLLADPVRHTEAQQQRDEGSEIDVQRQAQGRHRTHESASWRLTSTQKNLSGSIRVS